MCFLKNNGKTTPNHQFFHECSIIFTIHFGAKIPLFLETFISQLARQKHIQLGKFSYDFQNLIFSGHFGGDSLDQSPPFGMTSAAVAIICPALFWTVDSTKITPISEPSKYVWGLPSNPSSVAAFALFGGRKIYTFSKFRFQLSLFLRTVNLDTFQLVLSINGLFRFWQEVISSI